ncbi:MAG: hypothetical protein ACLUD2_07180 [Clostridium sp.]
MTLFTEGRLQAFERMMQDTGKYHRREDSEDRPRKCPKKKAEPAKRMVSTMPVFRVEKNSNYTTMCNYHLRDQGLSLKGKDFSPCCSVCRIHGTIRYGGYLRLRRMA